MANVVLGVLGHHVTQQVATGVAKRVGKFALDQGVKYAKKRISSPFRDTTKRLAESFQEIDTVPLKRRNVSCRDEEDCFHDGYFDSTSFSNSVVPHLWSDATALAYPFSPIQGDDINNRRGRSVVIRKVNVRGSFQLEDQSLVSGADTHTNPSVRFVVFVDRQAAGAAITADQLMTSSGTNQDVDSYRNLLYNNRFVVLEDRVFTLNPTLYTNNAGVVKSGQVSKYLHLEIPCEIEVRYNANNSGTVLDCLENALIYAVVAGSSNANRTGFDVRLYLQSRITFQSLSRY